jgi:outer membrane lipoprotein LolB
MLANRAADELGAARRMSSVLLPRVRSALALRTAPLLGALVLAGCATTRPPAPPTALPAAVSAPWEQRVTELQAWAAWDLAGRAAVAYGKQGWQASLAFTQSGSVSDVHLAGPLGLGAAELTLTPAGLTVNGGPPDPDVLNQIQAKLGFPLPIQELRYWLLGVPDPGSAATVTRNADDRAEELAQADWLVEIDRYLPVEGDVLPAHLVLTHEDVRIRIAVEHWHVPRAASD